MLGPAGAYSNPKPLFWEPASPYTVRSDEHGKQQATRATAFTYSKLDRKLERVKVPTAEFIIVN